MSSERIKQEIIKAYPETRASDWKRRSRNKTGDSIHRQFEHPDKGTIDTIENQDGTITIGLAGAQDSQGTTFDWGAVYEAVEIYVAGPMIDQLKPSFDEFGENPEVVALFRRNLYDENDGEYNGDGCDRLEMRDGYLYAALDGVSRDFLSEILEDCKACAQANPDHSYMLVGSQPVGDDEVQHYDVLFLRGFDAAHNPLKREHGNFYDEYVVRGI